MIHTIWSGRRGGADIPYRHPPPQRDAMRQALPLQWPGVQAFNNTDLSPARHEQLAAHSAQAGDIAAAFPLQRMALDDVYLRHPKDRAMALYDWTRGATFNPGQLSDVHRHATLLASLLDHDGHAQARYLDLDDLGSLQRLTQGVADEIRLAAAVHDIGGVPPAFEGLPAPDLQEVWFAHDLTRDYHDLERVAAHAAKAEVILGETREAALRRHGIHAERPEDELRGLGLLDSDFAALLNTPEVRAFQAALDPINRRSNSSNTSLSKRLLGSIIKPKNSASPALATQGHSTLRSSIKPALRSAAMTVGLSGRMSGSKRITTSKNALPDIFAAADVHSRDGVTMSREEACQAVTRAMILGPFSDALKQNVSFEEAVKRYGLQGQHAYAPMMLVVAQRLHVKNLPILPLVVRTVDGQERTVHLDRETYDRLLRDLFMVGIPFEQAMDMLAIAGNSEPRTATPSLDLHLPLAPIAVWHYGTVNKHEDHEDYSSHLRRQQMRYRADLSPEAQGAHLQRHFFEPVHPPGLAEWEIRKDGEWWEHQSTISASGPEGVAALQALAIPMARSVFQRHLPGSALTQKERESLPANVCEALQVCESDALARFDAIVRDEEPGALCAALDRLVLKLRQQTAEPAWAFTSQAEWVRLGERAKDDQVRRVATAHIHALASDADQKSGVGSARHSPYDQKRFDAHWLKTAASGMARRKLGFQKGSAVLHSTGPDFCEEQVFNPEVPHKQGLTREQWMTFSGNMFGVDAADVRLDRIDKDGSW